MLTGKLVRVRNVRDRIIPCYIDAAEPLWLQIGDQLRKLFQEAVGRTRGELEDEVRDTFGTDPSQLVTQGFAKLLEDRCEFEVVAGLPPETIRAAVFREAVRQRQRPVDDPGGAPRKFDRNAVLQTVATAHEIQTEDVEFGLFADLKSAQRLIRFKDIAAERLLDRYNLALAQAILLRSIRIQVNVRPESPARLRQLLRRIKFHRLIGDITTSGANSVRFQIDGPLSLFTSTQKYGFQLAQFLPAIVHCRDFDLQAELRWGVQRKPKRFMLSSDDGLVSHQADVGTYVPPELAMFAQQFQKKIKHWDLQEATTVTPIANHYWVPDYCLVHRATGRSVFLEVLGFWRRASAVVHLERLLKHVKEPFLLAVSENLSIDDTELQSLPAGIHRFRQMPLPDEIAKLADALIAHAPASNEMDTKRK